MSNVTVQEALKAAIDFIEEGYGEAERKQALALCKAALSEIEKCEPVVEAIRERDRLGFAVVNVIGKLDEIIENTQEIEIDDFLHIAVPIDMWNELESSLEDMPNRADLYTTPQRPQPLKRLSVGTVNKLARNFESTNDFADAIMDAMQEINK